MKASLAFILLEIIHLTRKAAVSSIEQPMNEDNDGCSDEWTLNPLMGGCYFISNQYARFDLAVKKCDAMFSSLASILSLEEQTFLLPLLGRERSNNTNYWLGLLNRRSGPNASASWIWIDGSAYTSKTSFWGEKFPSGKYDCGSLSTEQTSTLSIGHWEDEHCDKPMRYICKKATHGNILVKQRAYSVSLTKDSYFKASDQPKLTERPSYYDYLNCPKGWFTIHPYTSCFYLGKDDLTYRIASESCRSQSSVLAQLHSLDELKAVGNVIAKERNTCLYPEICKFWIGLRFTNVSGMTFSSWLWSDGTPDSPAKSILNKASFGLEAPADRFEQCAAMQVGDGNESSFALVSDCRNCFRYLCRRDLACPEGFVLIPKVNSCYKLITEAMNWTDASKTCQSISTDTHLVNIFNGAENDAVIAFMEAEIYKNPSICRSWHTGYSPNAWIGAQRILDTCSQPFVWKPSDKVQIPLNYTYWFQRQPSCDHGIEYCLHITKIWNYQWNDHRCNETKCALCERRFQKRN